MDGIIPQLLDFTASHGSTLTRHIQKWTDLNLHLIESFLSLLSAIMDRHSPKREDSVPYSSSRAGSSYFGSGSGTLSRLESVGSAGSLASLSSDQLRSSSAKMHSIVDQSYSELQLQSSVLSLPPVNEDSVVVLDEVDKLSTESDLDNMTQRYLVTTAFVFALIWSFGGYIDSRYLLLVLYMCTCNCCGYSLILCYFFTVTMMSSMGLFVRLFLPFRLPVTFSLRLVSFLIIILTQRLSSSSCGGRGRETVEPLHQLMPPVINMYPYLK